MTILWWHWVAAGLILIAIEMAALGGFYVIFFGVSALVIGLLSVVGLGSTPVQLLLFSVLSVVSLLFFRSPLLRWMRFDRQGVDVDSLVGETAVPLEDIAPGAVGRAELRGTVWSARNSSSAKLGRGERCTVTAVDRLTIFLKREGASA